MRRMSVVRTLALSLIATAAIAPASRAETEDLLKVSRAATQEFGASLKAQLGAALAAGGPVLAIDVCKTAAGAIASEVSRKHGLSVRRTALRVRNSENAPDAFEKQTLERFVAEIAQGKDPASLEHFEVVRTDAGEVFRYMKAIPTAAEPCLACHGSTLRADVRERLHDLYPNDQATGFKAGDLRGAFSISADIR